MGRKKRKRPASTQASEELAPRVGEVLEAERPRSVDAAAKGITTGAEFATVFSHLIGDLATGAVTPQAGNAMCNAGGKLLKMVEMNHRLGTQNPDGGQRKSLDLLT